MVRMTSRKRTRWEKWLAPHMRSQFIAEAIARFAAKTAADPVRPTLLAWLAREVASHPPASENNSTLPSANYSPGCK
jgi:hypothetical protein